jgi:cytoskeletal protein CcmA (bactofilin family)
MAKLSTSEFTHTGANAGDFHASQPTLTIPQLPGAAWVEERTRVAVARSVNVSGRLVFQEPVRIEGNFHGEVSSSELVVISDHGTIEGRVRSPRLLVLGELRGDVIGSRLVVLGPRARVFGRIEADSLRVCEGALIEGDVRVPCGGAASR